MITKNLIIGAIAAILSSAATFASTLAIPQYVKVGTACRRVNALDCGTAGSFICRVDINGFIYSGYLDSACTILVSRTTSGTVEGEFVD